MVKKLVENFIEINSDKDIKAIIKNWTYSQVDIYNVTSYILDLYSGFYGPKILELLDNFKNNCQALAMQQPIYNQRVIDLAAFN